MKLYFVAMYDDGFNASLGRYTFFRNRLLVLKNPRKNVQPQTMGSLKGWQARCPGRMRLPIPEEMACYVADHLVRRNELDAATPLVLQLEAYLRPSEAVTSAMHNVLPPAPMAGAAYARDWGSVIAPQATGQRTKTGATDDSLLLGDVGHWLGVGSHVPVANAIGHAAVSEVGATISASAGLYASLAVVDESVGVVLSSSAVVVRRSSVRRQSVVSHRPSWSILVRRRPSVVSGRRVWRRPSPDAARARASPTHAKVRRRRRGLGHRPDLLQDHEERVGLSAPSGRLLLCHQRRRGRPCGLLLVARDPCPPSACV